MFRDRKRTIRQQRMMGQGELEFFATGRAPCVVALHGFGGTAAELRPLLERIAAQGYAVEAALLPGHGTRAEHLQEETFDTWAAASRERVRVAIKAHGRIALLGFSLGSLLALQLASEQPQGLAGLVVLGNALTLKPLTSVPFAVWERIGRPMPDVYLLKPRSADLVDPRAMNDVVTYDRHPLRAALEVYRAGARVRDVVGRITCPTLVLHGRHDFVCSWRNAVWLQDRLGTRDVSVRIFEKSAHVLACDGERDEVAAETTAFLARLT